MPSAASTTCKGLSESRRSASRRVNIGGMCCTINTGTRRLAGSCGIKLASACGPPVETPIPRIWKGASRLTARPVRRGRTAQPAPAWAEAQERAPSRREELTDFRNQFAAQAGQRLVQRPGVGGLGDVIVRAQGERFEGGRRAARGQRTEHDGAQPWMQLANLPQRGRVRPSRAFRYPASRRPAAPPGCAPARRRRSARRPPPRCPASSRSACMTRCRMTTESSTTRTRIFPCAVRVPRSAVQVFELMAALRSDAVCPPAPRA